MTSQSVPAWSEIDTVFLDMDGTLLDLHYDNQVWNNAVPVAFAKVKNLPLPHARELLLTRMQEIRGTIEFYSFDYWSEFTGVDLIEVHQQHTSLVRYRSGALKFLRALKLNNKFTIIATNAHLSSVAVKDAKINISQEVDAVVSSQEYQAPKESLAYWHAMHEQHPFEPDRAIFIDDNEPVLDQAREFGIKHLWTVVTPDSQRPPRADLAYPSFDSFHDLRVA